MKYPMNFKNMILTIDSQYANMELQNSNNYYY